HLRRAAAEATVRGLDVGGDGQGGQVSHGSQCPRRRNGWAKADPIAARLQDGIGAPTVTAHRGRSEERRVGKECRSRWSPHHEKKKQSADRRWARTKQCAAAGGGGEQRREAGMRLCTATVDG